MNYYECDGYDPREVPAEDPHIRRLLDCQYTPEFEAYCQDCRFRAHGSFRPTASCWPSIREKMHCFKAFSNGKAGSAHPDYSGQISAVCGLLNSQNVTLNGIDMTLSNVEQKSDGQLQTLSAIKNAVEGDEHDYSSYLSAICGMLGNGNATLRSIDAKADELHALSAIKNAVEGEDIDDSVLDSDEFKKLEKIGKLICEYSTENITAEKWLKLFVIAKMFAAKKSQK